MSTFSHPILDSPRKCSRATFLELGLCYKNKIIQDECSTVFRSARASYRAFDDRSSTPIFPEFIDVQHCCQASGTPQTVYFLKVLWVSDMRAKSTNFLAVVEWCEVRLPENVETFSYTQFAYLCHWIERLPPVQDFPAHWICGSSGLAIPNVGTQDCFMLVVPVVEGFAVVAPPCFEIGGAPQ